MHLQSGRCRKISVAVRSILDPGRADQVTGKSDPVTGETDQSPGGMNQGAAGKWALAEPICPLAGRFKIISRVSTPGRAGPSVPGLS
jgi:hypothetical protein